MYSCVLCDLQQMTDVKCPSSSPFFVKKQEVGRCHESLKHGLSHLGSTHPMPTLPTTAQHISVESRSSTPERPILWVLSLTLDVQVLALVPPSFWSTLAKLAFPDFTIGSLSDRSFIKSIDPKPSSQCRRLNPSIRRDPVSWNARKQKLQGRSRRLRTPVTPSKVLKTSQNKRVEIMIGRLALIWRPFRLSFPSRHSPSCDRGLQPLGR